MASRRWAGTAVGVYRLLLEQQAGAAAGAASRQLWQAELSLCLRPSSAAAAAAGGSSSMHTAASLRLWLPAATQCVGLLPDAEERQRRRESWRRQAAATAGLHGSAAAHAIHKESSVKSHLTQPPPLAGMQPFDTNVPHVGTPHEHPRPASQAAQYEAADAGAPLCCWLLAPGRAATAAGAGAGAAGCLHPLLASALAAHRKRVCAGWPGRLPAWRRGVRRGDGGVFGGARPRAVSLLLFYVLCIGLWLS